MHTTYVYTLQVYAHAGAVIDGKIYIACGRRGMAYLKETYCYDPSGNHWSICAEGPVERAWHGMAALNGRAYVIGGSNDGCGYRRDVLKVLNLCSVKNVSIRESFINKVNARPASCQPRQHHQLHSWSKGCSKSQHVSRSVNLSTFF